jgi:hypothetical protein
MEPEPLFRFAVAGRRSLLLATSLHFHRTGLRMPTLECKGAPTVFSDFAGLRRRVAVAVAPFISRSASGMLSHHPHLIRNDKHHLGFADASRRGQAGEWERTFLGITP